MQDYRGGEKNITYSYNIGEINSDVGENYEITSGASQECYYLLKENNAIPGDAIGRNEGEIMNIAQFADIINKEVKENNENNNIKWNLWKIENNILVFE